MSETNGYMQVGNSLTNGTADIGNATSYWYWPYDYTYPYQYQNVYVSYPSSWPAWCWGETHVFACERAEKCKCGKASRVPEPKKCATCGK